MESLESFFDWESFFEPRLHSISLFFSNTNRCNRFNKVCIKDNPKIQVPRAVSCQLFYLKLSVAEMLFRQQGYFFWICDYMSMVNGLFFETRMNHSEDHFCQCFRLHVQFFTTNAGNTCILQGRLVYICLLIGLCLWVDLMQFFTLHGYYYIEYI